MAQQAHPHFYFAAYKKKIYDYFFEDSDEKYEVEYVI